MLQCDRFVTTLLFNLFLQNYLLRSAIAFCVLKNCFFSFSTHFFAKLPPSLRNRLLRSQVCAATRAAQQQQRTRVVCMGGLRGRSTVVYRIARKIDLKQVISISRIGGIY